MRKEIPIFAGQKNYTITAKSKATLKRSLAHTLRHLPGLQEHEMKSIEWNENLLDQNTLYIDDKIIPLESLSNEQKESLIERFTSPTVINKKQKQTQLGNYRAKIKKTIVSEQKQQNLRLVTHLESLLTYTQQDIIDESILEVIQPFLKTRAKQRLNMLKKYIHAHNALTDTERAGQHTRYQEVIFKIPNQWQVNNETFTSEHNYKLLKGFLARVLPEHPIKLAVTHGDERLDNEDLCSHIHCFIDGKNSITQTFDLRHTEERAIDRYVTNTLSMEEQNIWTECKAKKNYQYSKLRGEYWQAMFLLYANYFLENENIPLKAVRLDKTQERIEKNKQMRVEAKLPKHQRSHNFHTRALEEEKMILERIAQAERLEATRIREYEKEQETRDAERQSARAKSIKQEEEIQANEKHLQLIKNRNDAVTKGLEKKIQIQAQLNYDNERLAIDKADNIARLKKLTDQVDANDIVKILLKIFASIDRYISSKKSDSHYQTFYRQVIEAFKELNDWATETLVMKYLKVGEHEIKDYSLTKELKGLQTPKREKNVSYELE